MRFNRYSDLAGRHAFLSASKGTWLNYDDEKLSRVFLSNMAAQRGTDLHDLASKMIKLKFKAPDTPTTVNLYVNDCIGFRMTPEQTLFYSANCFGTADAISFQRNILRISDLKTGVLHTSERQLEIYSAIFCLEYNVNPHDIVIELRIYQNDEVREYIAEPNDIRYIMEKIKDFDKQISALREETE